MDSVTTAIIAAVSASLDTGAKEAVKDAYHSLKQAIKKRIGIAPAPSTTLKPHRTQNNSSNGWPLKWPPDTPTKTPRSPRWPNN
jgi:DNA-binding SARP family transcriptional activator